MGKRKKIIEEKKNVGEMTLAAWLPSQPHTHTHSLSLA